MACGLTLPSTGAPQLQRKRQLKTRSSTMSKSGNKSGKGEQQREDGVGDNQHISEQFLPKVWAISLSRARTNPQPQPHAHRHTSTHSPSPSLLIAFLLSLPPHCLPRFGAVRHAMPGAMASGGPAPRMRGWQGAGRHRARPESSTDHPGHCPRRRGARAPESSNRRRAHLQTQRSARRRSGRVPGGRRGAAGHSRRGERAPSVVSCATNTYSVT